MIVEVLRENLPNGMGLFIIEVNNPIARNHFLNRFQVVLIIDGKRHLPKLKKKFEEFKSSDYIYDIRSDITGENVRVSEIVYYEKLICDKSYEECTTELLEHLSTYNKTKNFKKEMKKIFT